VAKLHFKSPMAERRRASYLISKGFLQLDFVVVEAECSAPSNPLALDPSNQEETVKSLQIKSLIRSYLVGLLIQSVNFCS
jgi:hypothetical protein